MARTATEWPALPLDRWRDTYATLHMWTQIVGKVCLALTPRVNHFWNIAFQVTPRGLETATMTSGERTLRITFDLIAHQLLLEISDGTVRRIPLQPRSVAAFYRILMDTMREVEIPVRIWPVPVEVPDPIRFTEDETHHSYDPEYANAFLRALLAIKPIFQSFRCDFVGKCSPVHFFWGSFDLAVSRFSGRRAPDRPDADAMTKESYSHEVISHGFWPGSGAVTEAAFYAYTVPPPPGFEGAPVEPAAATFNKDFGEFILPYEAVRRSADPERTLTSFLNSTYEAGARLAGWNRDELERR